MRTLEFDNLLDMAKGFPPAMLAATERLVGTVHLDLHNHAIEALRAITPRQSGETALLVASDPTNPESAVEALQPTSVGYGGTSEQRRKANALNIGRRSTKTPYKVRRGGKTFLVERRVIGSRQAPKGMKGPVLRQLKAREEEILAAAIAKAEAGS